MAFMNRPARVARFSHHRLSPSLQNQKRRPKLELRVRGRCKTRDSVEGDNGRSTVSPTPPRLCAIFRHQRLSSLAVRSLLPSWITTFWQAKDDNSDRGDRLPLRRSSPRTLGVRQIQPRDWHGDAHVWVGDPGVSGSPVGFRFTTEFLQPAWPLGLLPLCTLLLEPKLLCVW